MQYGTSPYGAGHLCACTVTQQTARNPMLSAMQSLDTFNMRACAAWWSMHGLADLAACWFAACTPASASSLCSTAVHVEAGLMVPLVHPKQRLAGGCRAPVACLAFCRDFATAVAASDALRTGMCVCYCTFSACWRGGCQCLRCLPRGQLALCRSLQRARTCGPTWVWLSGECAAANEPGAMPRLQQRDEAFVPVWHCVSLALPCHSHE